MKSPIILMKTLTVLYLQKKVKLWPFFCIDVEKEIQSKGSKNTQQQKTMRT